MTKKPRDDVVPPDNYSAVERQMMKLQAIPAMLEAERLIAEKFAEPETTGIFKGDPGPAIWAEEAAQAAEWRQYEQEMAARSEPGIGFRLIALVLLVLALVGIVLPVGYLIWRDLIRPAI